MSMATELKNLQQHQIYKNVETGLVRDISSINQLSSLRTLLCMISHGHFQENKDVLIENLVEHLNNLFSDENFDEINEWKYSDLTDVIMWLTYLNVYNEKILELPLPFLTRALTFSTSIQALQIANFLHVSGIWFLCPIYIPFILSI